MWRIAEEAEVGLFRKPSEYMPSRIVRAALLVVFLAGLTLLASCGGNSLVGTWTHPDHFKAGDGSRQNVIVTLVLKDDGTFTVDGDGFTEPSHYRGTYTVKGDTVELSPIDVPAPATLVAKLVSGKLIFLPIKGGMTFTKRSTSRASAVASSPSTLPFAPPVTPAAGEPYVGYWCVEDALFPAYHYLEVLRGAQGYQASWSGGRPFPVPLKNGRLVLQRLHETPTQGGAQVTSGLELAWENGKLVLYTKPESMIPWQRQFLRRLTQDQYLKGVTAFADEMTRESCENLALAVDQWTSRRGLGPPAPAQMHPGSAFDRWLVKLTRPATWVWPQNLFTREPMQNSTQPGDFTYVANGGEWTMKGHLSDGTTFDALSQ